MKNKIIAVVVLIVVAGGAFYLGVQNGKSGATAAATAARAGFTRGVAGGVARTGATSGGFAGGQIVSKDATSLTVGVQGGGSKIVFFTSSTPITKTVSGSLSDLTIGTNVSVVGTANSDGSESATSIQIRPAGFGTTTRAAAGQ
jgi:hypothetical protein